MKADWLRPAREAVWGPASTKIRRGRLREPAINSYRALARVVLTGPPPRIFANSIPKAGTHLLTQLLSKVPKVWFAGLHVADGQFRGDLHAPGDKLGEFDIDAFMHRIKVVRNGQFMTAHIPCEPPVVEALRDTGFRTLLMIRDPRDIAVSMAHYFATNRRLNTYARFAAMPTLDERLMAVITGLPPEGDCPAVPSMGDRLARYQPWLNDQNTCVTRFEELVGSAGGGSDEAQLDAVRRVLVHCRRNDDPDRADKVANEVFARHSATFRRGAIGEWRAEFGSDHRAAFDEVAPGALAVFGYE